LIRAHPELAGKAMVSKSLTAESTNEQGRAGLTDCTPHEFARIQQLNAAYNAKFGWPFILAVRGPRGAGLTRARDHRHLRTPPGRPPDFELAECLRNIHRIAEIRLNDKFGATPVWGQQRLGLGRSPGTAQRPRLRRAGPAHGDLPDAGPPGGGSASCRAGCRRRASTRLASMRWAMWWRLYHGSDPAAPRLLTGSHYDTVRNGGKYDGRLGILVPMAVVQQLHAQGRRLPFGIEVVAFAEEEGQRYKATFLGSWRAHRHFEPGWLDQTDADGVPMRDAMRSRRPAGHAGRHRRRCSATRRATKASSKCTSNKARCWTRLDLPLGVVSSINGSLRFLGEVTGQASHAGTTPMGSRRDAACAVAELALYVESRAAAVPDVVGTVGQLQVPQGSINVVPGRCQFSLDLRATTNAARDALARRRAGRTGRASANGAA
jgi:N-carbamoyl-L-amino-acid hydrolase